MITLYQFPRILGIPNASPFCMKLETWLRMASLDYEVKDMPDPRKAPKAKLPFIVDNGKKIADSALIIHYLQSHYNLDLDALLSSKEKAIARSMMVMLEEHYYWGLLYNRWCDDNWKHTKEAFFSAMPALIRNIVPPMLQKGIKSALYAHGMGRHDKSDIYALANADMQAVAEYMTDSPYLMGNQPTTVDATLYALLSNVLNSGMESPLKDEISQHANLIAYTQRMTEKYFPEFL